MSGYLLNPYHKIGDSVLIEPVARLLGKTIICKFPELYENHPLVRSVGFGKYSDVLNVGPALGGYDLSRLYRYVGISDISPIAPMLYLSDDERLQAEIIRAIPNRVAIVRSYSLVKCYPYMGLLIRALLKRRYHVFCFDKSRYMQGAINIVGAPIRVLMCLLSAMDMVIGDDTGLCHLSAALGVPTYVIGDKKCSGLYNVYGCAQVVSSSIGILTISVSQILRTIGKRDHPSLAKSLYVMPGTYGDTFLSRGIVSKIKERYSVDVMTRAPFFEMFLDLGVHLIEYPYAEVCNPSIIKKDFGNRYSRIYTPYYGLQGGGKRYLNYLIKGKKQFAQDYAEQCGFQIKEIQPLSLPEVAVSTPERYIVTQASSPLSSKNWPYFQNLYTLIQDNYPDIKIIQLGAKGEPQYENTIPMFGLSFHKVSYIVNRAILYVGVDSVIAHMSTVAGIPTITIFGGTDANVSKGWGKSVVAIAPRYPISDGKHTCYRACHQSCWQNRTCISTITVERIYQEVIKWMKK